MITTSVKVRPNKTLNKLIKYLKLTVSLTGMILVPEVMLTLGKRCETCLPVITLFHGCHERK